jgi:peptidoglycan/LPS O-acetylase OafA/YrhL
MNHRKLIVPVAGVLLLAPSVAMANGMGRMIQSFEFTLAGGVIGCVAGVIFALVRHAKIGRLLAFAMGGGLIAGLIAAAMFVGGNLEFFSNNAGIVGALAIIALGTAVVGGLAAGLIGVGVRALRRGSAEKSVPAEQDKSAP